MIQRSACLSARLGSILVETYIGTQIVKGMAVQVIMKKMQTEVVMQTVEAGCENAEQ